MRTDDQTVGDDPGGGAARESTRSDVAAALAPRPRRCSACGHVETAARRTCSACGADLIVSARDPRARRRRIAIAGAAVVALAAVLAVAVPPMLDDAERERARAAERQRALEARERERLLREVRPRRVQGPSPASGETPLEHRARLVSAGERAITADARRRMREGSVDGPVKGTSCRPSPATQTRRDAEGDPRVTAARYQCIAYEDRFELPPLEGQARTGVYGVLYWLVVDYDSARLTFCKFSPRPGEGGKALATITVPDACADPLRGY